MKLLALVTNLLTTNRTPGGRSRALGIVVQDKQSEPSVQAGSDVGSNFKYVGRYTTNTGEQVVIKRNRDKTLSVNYFDTSGQMINSDSGVILLNKQLQLTFTGLGTRQNGTIRFEESDRIWIKISDDRIVKNLGELRSKVSRCICHYSIFYSKCSKEILVWFDDYHHRSFANSLVDCNSQLGHRFGRQGL